MEPISHTDPPSQEPDQPDSSSLSQPGSADPTQNQAGSGSRRRLFFNPNPAPSKPPRKGTVFQLQVVFAVAGLLATLFTAWTPGRPNLLFANSTPQVNLSEPRQPTPTYVPGQPTAALKNPRLVGIVAGHWKNDSGAVCADGLKEVDVNLKIATLVQKILTDEGYQVDLLQEFDPRLTGYQAAALVSIHNDSCDFINNEATGFKVASAFATRHPERPARLTACLRARYAAATGLPVHSTSVTPDMSSYHAFDEIDEITPASIIETGFLNLDRTFLTQQTDKVAEGIANGVLCYLRNESVSSPQITQPTPTSP